jgi:two-component system nitrogen regulation response regulator GlnG
MAPAQVIELKDLPPEVLAMAGTSMAALSALPEAVATPTTVLPPVTSPAPAALSEALQLHSAPLAVAEPAHVLDAVQAPPPPGWETGLQAEALALLEEGRTDVWDVLTRRFETKLIQTALVNTRGRRIEAAHKLGIGRNTITRKIQELNLE